MPPMNPKSHLDLLARKPRTRQDMIAYLTEHFRYDTMNSWNRATSYAHNIKISHLNHVEHDLRNRLYDMIGVEGTFDESGYNECLREFHARHAWAWQIGTNGRSGGYLVLYQGGRKATEHKSRCTQCGQLNFKRVPVVPPADGLPVNQARFYIQTHNFWTPATYLEQPEIKALGLPDAVVLNLVKEVQADMKAHGEFTGDNTCGRCRAQARVNLTSPVYESFSWPGRGLDMDKDVADWDTSTLRDRVEIVWDFDQTCERAVRYFVDFARRHHAEEQTVLVERQVTVAVED